MLVLLKPTSDLLSRVFRSRPPVDSVLFLLYDSAEAKDFIIEVLCWEPVWGSEPEKDSIHQYIIHPAWTLMNHAVFDFWAAGACAFQKLDSSLAFSFFLDDISVAF